MKKLLILAGICLTMCSGLVAQDFQGGRGQGGPNGQRMRRQMDAVVDTAIINHIDLSAEVLQKVYDLQKVKQEEQAASMKELRQNRGQRMSEEDRKAMMDKRQAFTAQYRKELRAIIGDEAYILYLEKSLDNRSMMRFGGQGGQRQGGQRPMGGGQGGFGGNGGGFGGGFDNGGGF